MDIGTGSNRFHGTLIAALTAWVVQAASAAGLNQVALSGGCLLNRVLAEGLSAALRGQGLTPLLPRLLPPNDGAISLGQVHVARSSVPRQSQYCFAKPVRPELVEGQCLVRRASTSSARTDLQRTEQCWR
jgi:tRNA A37 threonylcarbamoyltransferase TsaD